MRSRTVTSRTQFEGIHCWPEAPDEVSYLRNPHRHIFEVVAEIEVEHNDRDLEFIMVKHQIDKRLSCELDDHGVWQMGRTSCEDVAEMLLGFLEGKYPNRTIFVSVYEDGENGCTLGNVSQGGMR